MAKARLVPVCACRAVSCAMEGLLLNRDIWDNREPRVRLRTLISRALLTLREDDARLPSPAAE